MIKLTIRVWRSLVSRLVRVQETVGSNPATRTKGKSLWDLPFYFVNFHFLLHGTVQRLAVGRLYVEVLFYM